LLLSKDRWEHQLIPLNAAYTCTVLLYCLLLLDVLALVYATLQAAWVAKRNPGGVKMISIAHSIAQGAIAFLKAECRTISCFIGIAALFLGYLSITSGYMHLLIMVAFVTGAIFSALAGWAGMKIATQTNVRTAQAARTSTDRFFSGYRSIALFARVAGGVYTNAS
jgi:K(+)-stimulated pyrophosphate-energized sodium pump